MTRSVARRLLRRGRALHVWWPVPVISPRVARLAAAAADGHTCWRMVVR